MVYTNRKLKHSYEELSTEDLVLLAQNDDTEALEYILDSFKNLVKSKSRAYFLIGADKEDLIQEGMIGLYKAIRDFKEDKISSFRAFADICITRQIITAVKTATRQKHIPLNSYISLDKPIFDEENDKTLMDVIKDEMNNPEDLIISKENFHGIGVKLSEILSSLEKDILTLYLQGISYSEIALKLNKPAKSIDNALQRVKKKVDMHINR